TPEIEALRAYYAAINRNDLPAAFQIFDPEIEWTEPEGFPESATRYGSAALTAHITKQRGNWAEGGCEPERLVVSGDRVISVVHVNVRQKNRTEWNDGRIGEVYTFRDGKIVHGRLFMEPEEAFEWSGIADPEAN